MARPDQSAVQRSESPAGAGLAGVGGGTFLALIAAKWPDTDPLKSWIIYSIPTVSVLLTAGSVWAQVRIANYVQERKVTSLITKAKAKLEAALANPNTSEEHKSRLQDELEQLEMFDVERIMTKVKSVKVISAKDVKQFHRSHNTGT